MAEMSFADFTSGLELPDVAPMGRVRTEKQQRRAVAFTPEENEALYKSENQPKNLEDWQRAIDGAKTIEQRQALQEGLDQTRVGGFTGGQARTPKIMSLEEFSSGELPKADRLVNKPVSEFRVTLQDTLQRLKQAGGEAAALADMVFGMPVFLAATGAQLTGTVRAMAEGSKEPFAQGREVGKYVSQRASEIPGIRATINPMQKLLAEFGSEDLAANSSTTKGMEKLMGLVEEAGVWVEQASGGRVSRDAVPMFAEVLMSGATGIGSGRAKPAIAPEMAKRLREHAEKMRDQAELEAKSQFLTPAEFMTRLPVQQQINDLLAIRTPAEQAKITRQRRKDVQQAFREPAEGSDFASVEESQFRAGERMDREAAYTAEQADPAVRIGGEAYEIGSKQTPERIGQAEILSIMQKPAFERTAEDLITLREARKEGGNASPEALMLLSAAGIGAAAGAMTDEKLQGAILGGAVGASAVLPFIGRGPSVPSGMKQSGAVKAPGGMWHPEAVDRLTRPLEDQLGTYLPRFAEPIGGDPAVVALNAARDISRYWPKKAIRNYLNKYAGTEKDPLKDVEIPFGRDIKRWGELTDSLFVSRQVKDIQNFDYRIGQRGERDMPAELRRAPADEPVWDFVNRQSIAEMPQGARDTTRYAGVALQSYLAHVGDFLKQHVAPEKLQQYDLVRAVRETAENDRRVAKEMEKAQSASTAQLPVHKEYPDGMKWVELRLPEKLTEEQGKQIRPASRTELKNEIERLNQAFDSDKAAEHAEGYVAKDANGKDIRNSYTGSPAVGATPEEAWLAGRLAEEGNQMGHCVGGYCEGVASGESKIYSLRDKKGLSHVTVEVSPFDIRKVSDAVYDNFVDQHPAIKERFGNIPRFTSHTRVSDVEGTAIRRSWREDIRATPEFKQWLLEQPSDIQQIKGKQNRAPAAAYLPYVQDFVKEGKWGEVGDLEGTGLIEISGGLQKERGLPRYATREEITKADEKFETSTAREETARAGQELRDVQARNRQRGFIDQRLVVGLGGLGLGGILGSYLSDDPASGALLGALAGGSLALPGVQRRLKQAAEAADYGIGNISTRIGNISPALRQRARLFEMRNLTESHRVLHEVVPFMKALDKVPESKLAPLERALLTNDAPKIAELMKGNPELVSGWRQVRNTLNDLGTKLAGYGRFRSMKDDYFPRLVKDVEGLKAALGTPERTKLQAALDEAQAAAMKSRGTPLTNIEQSAIINREVQAIRRARGYLPGFAKDRAVAEITEQLRPFYHTPSESLYAYIRGATQDLETAKFFGKELAQRRAGGQEYIDLDTSIGNVVGRELVAGKITHPQAQKLIDMLQSRFRGGERSSNAIIQDLRNLGNIGLLGNIVSGATQAADAMMAVYAQDLRSTLASIGRQLSGRERITAQDFGLADHIAEEFVSGTRTAGWLNKMFKYSGFAAIDRFGKTTLLNAALSRAERLSSTPNGVKRLREKYGEAYGEEFPQLVGDLAAGRMTERVRSMLFSELSDMQPISKLEMPQAYLDHPNGRLIYMLKTFMMKQMDVVRRDAYNEIKKGNVAKGLKNLTEYGLVLGISGATTQMVKDWLMGNPVNFAPTDVMEQMLRTFGWGEYVRDKAAQGRPVEALAGTIAPPYRMMDDIIRRDPKAAQYVPLVGKLFYSWELGGQEEAELRQARKDRKAGRETDLSARTENYQEQKREKARERREAAQ